MTDKERIEQLRKGLGVAVAYVNDFGGTSPTWDYVQRLEERLIKIERLAKVEVLEEALNKLQSSDSYESFEHSLNYMIAELKEAILNSPVKEGKTDAEKID